MTDILPFDGEKKRIKERFDEIAHSFNEAAFLSQEIAERILQRLEFIRIQPIRILDLGSGTGILSNELKKVFPSAEIVALDFSENMLRQNVSSWKTCGDAEQMPFQDQRSDLVISNLMLHWSQNLFGLSEEIHRVLKPQGLFMFSMLGADTLTEMHHAWRSVDNNAHVNDFVDMHDMGDCLLQVGMADPVMDMEHIVLTYKTMDRLFEDMHFSGSILLHENRSSGLITPRQLERFKQAYELLRDNDGRLPVTVEMIYGHAWKNELNNRGVSENGVVKVGIPSLNARV